MKHLRCPIKIILEYSNIIFFIGCRNFIRSNASGFGETEPDLSCLTLNNFQNYIITNHYQFTTPLSYGDMLWKDNPFNPVT
jgi:hypothetical protein